MRVPRSIKGRSVPFPTSYFCSLKYVETYNLDQTTADPIAQQWRLNSLYDFDYTSTLGDHQPYFYDQLTAIYKKYKVYATKIRFEFSSNQDTQIVFRPTVLSTTPTSTVLEAERPKAISYTYALGGPPIVRTLKYKMSDLFGVSRFDYRADENYSGLAPGSSPSNIAYLNFLADSPRTVPSEHTLKITATFFCKFYERQPISQS